MIVWSLADGRRGAVAAWPVMVRLHAPERFKA
jgi:hypothetical protein